MFDAEAWYIRDILLGRVKLPASRAARQDDMKTWAAKEAPLRSAVEKLRFQREYLDDLNSATDYTCDTAAVEKRFYEWKMAKERNICTYRDSVHTSVVTGNVQAKHHTTWFEATDDSMATFLKPQQSASEE